MKWIVALLVIWGVWHFLRKPKRKAAQPDPQLVRDAAEARAVLGVSTDADAEAIRTAHRRLLAAVHPDRGGSSEVAGRVNAARDLLLRLAE
jgi:DnaJ family protein C protein 19